MATENNPVPDYFLIDEHAPTERERNRGLVRQRDRFLLRPAHSVAVSAGLVLLVLIAFMPALQAGMVAWDDDDLLIYTTTYRILSGESLRWMFTTSYAGHFQPLTWLSYSLDWAVWGREDFGYHLTNVLLHAATAVSFFFLCRRLLAAGADEFGGVRSDPVVIAAFAAAALFAVHPLRVESVAWLAERRDVLAGLPFVLAVLCYVRYAAARSVADGEPSGSEAIVRPPPSVERAWMLAEGGRTCLEAGGRMPEAGRASSPASSPPARASRQAYAWFALSWLLCAVSLLAKASAVVLPFVLLILDVYPLRRVTGARPTYRSSSAPLHGSTPHVRSHGFTRLIVEKIPFFVLAVIAGARALEAQNDGGALNTLAEHGVAERLAQACIGLVFYPWKTLVPSGLGPLYEIPPRSVLLGPMLWISVAVILSAAIAAWNFRRRLPAIPAAFLAYCVIVSPVLGIAQSGRQLVADRYSYLSCMALAVLAGAGLLRMLGTPEWLTDRRRRATLALGATVILVVLVRLTFRQSDFWQSPQTLWARGVRISPNSSIAHTNYADALARLGRQGPVLNAALGHYLRALELDDRDAVAWHHLANLQRQLGSADQAVHGYLRALAIDPNRRNACFAVAQLLIDRGEARRAVLILHDGIRRHPEARDMMLFLARLLSTHPDEDVRNGTEAVQWALKVNRAEGFRWPPSLMTLATAYAEVGRFDEAVDAAHHGLELADQNGDQPVAVELRRRLALFEQGKPFHVTD